MAKTHSINYAALALLFYLFENDWGRPNKPQNGLNSPELSKRNERITELERRFEELESSDGSG